MCISIKDVLVYVQRLIESMNNANVDVIFYPTWSDPPRLIGEYYIADGAALVAFNRPTPQCTAFGPVYAAILGPDHTYA